MHRALTDGEFKAVVFRRIVGARDLNAADDIEMMKTPVIQRRRDNADVDDVRASARETVDQRVTELWPARPIVAADGDRA